VLIIGFQAPETLGRRLVERRREVRIHGQPIECNAEIVVMNGFSAHGDRDDLMKLLGPHANPARQARIVHGELDQADALRHALLQAGYGDVAVPDRGESVVLNGATK
jgi:metallo-beta-lactamase family protein